MKSLQERVRKVTPEQIRYLLAVMVASALGSFATTALLEAGTCYLDEGTWLARLLLTAGAVLVYGLGVWSGFYLLLPSARPALRQIVPLVGRQQAASQGHS